MWIQVSLAEACGFGFIVTWIQNLIGTGSKNILKPSKEQKE